MACTDLPQPFVAEARDVLDLIRRYAMTLWIVICIYDRRRASRGALAAAAARQPLLRRSTATPRSIATSCKRSSATWQAAALAPAKPTQLGSRYRVGCLRRRKRAGSGTGDAATHRPVGSKKSRAYPPPSAAMAAIVLTFGVAGLYLTLGSPDLPGQPLAERMAKAHGDAIRSRRCSSGSRSTLRSIRRTVADGR